jgi:hypothetical protein
MVQADVLKAQIGAEERQTAAAKDSIAKQIANLEAKQITLTDRLEELKKEKEELAARVDEDLLDRFNRLFASKGDAAVVALEHDVCTGCPHENYDANGSARKRRQRNRELRAVRPDFVFCGVGRACRRFAVRSAGMRVRSLMTLKLAFPTGKRLQVTR